ncbi:hypothetical protein R5R35_007304 [Gryllus longicercus]|uniref:Uncharacterized protein n=1 Tax=Gryllus longicercus TaxID=2509291 RepID=A0AAN9V6R3_9ORTH
MLKILRRGSARYLLFSGVLLTVLVCLYYANYNTAANSTATVASRELAGAPAAAVVAVADGGGGGGGGVSGAAKADGAARKDGGDGALAAPVETRAAGPAGGAGDAAAAAPEAAAAAAEEEWMEPDSAINEETCPIMPGASTDVDTVEQFKKFEFQVGN